MSPDTRHPLHLAIAIRTVCPPDADELVPAASDNVLPVLAGSYTEDLALVPFRLLIQYLASPVRLAVRLGLALATGRGFRRHVLTERRPGLSERFEGVPKDGAALRRDVNVGRGQSHAGGCV